MSHAILSVDYQSFIDFKTSVINSHDLWNSAEYNQCLTSPTIFFVYDTRALQSHRVSRRYYHQFVVNTSQAQVVDEVR